MYSDFLTARPARILIPVYNGFEHAKNCILSVLKYTPENIKIFVVDDASPDGLFTEFLKDKLSSDSRLEFKRNSKNIGFVKTCNDFFKLHVDFDVVILNSDTRVTHGWFENLTRAAYSAPNVGTVTPFSNNATICSLPQFCKNNSLPRGISETDCAEILSSFPPKDYPEIPTCVGFCTYIRRSLLNAVGFFNEKVFGRGYGEENDLSRRAVKANFKNILDYVTFVYHEGSVSFGDQVDHKPYQNEKALLKLHPEYSEVVRDFVTKNPLESFQTEFSRALLKLWMNRFSGKHVLHFLHNGPQKQWNGAIGGTEQVVTDLIQECPQFGHWSLVPTKKNYILSAHLGEYSIHFAFKKNKEFLNHLLEGEFFSVLHFHHLMGFDLNHLLGALKKDRPYVVSIHDFFWVCLRMNLVTRNGFICEGKNCLDSCFENSRKIENHRLNVLSLLHRSREIFYFSDFSRNRIQKILSFNRELKWTKTRHGLPSLFFHNNRDRTKPPRLDRSKFRVLFLGAPTSTKGLDLFRAAKELDKMNPDSHLEWLELGIYQRQTLPQRILELNPHVVCILSRVPETYSLTLDEAWAMGVPTLVTPIGALAERSQELQAGWILKDEKPETLLDTLRDLSQAEQRYGEVRLSLAAKTRALPISHTTQIYSNSYAQLLTPTPNSFTQIEALLAEGDEPSPEKNLDLVSRIKRSRVYSYFSKFRFLRKLKRNLTGF